MAPKDRKPGPPKPVPPPYMPAVKRTPVRVILLDGEEVEGTLVGFNPQKEKFLLHTKQAGPQAQSRSIRFEEVKAIQFLREGKRPAQEEAVPKTAGVVTLCFIDGETLKGVTAGYSGQRSGLYMTPVAAEGVDRIYVPMTSIREIVSVKRLGEIMAEQGLVLLDSIDKVLAAQKGLRQEPVGQILLRRQLIDEKQLMETLNRQKMARKRIGEILVEEKFINRTQLEEALRLQSEQRGKKFGEVMVEMGLATQRMVAIALAIQYNLPFVDLVSQGIDPEALQLVPLDTLQRLQALPYKRQDNQLNVAICDPTDHTAREEIHRHTGLVVLEALTTPDGIRAALEKHTSP